jgi:hypothetical protein
MVSCKMVSGEGDKGQLTDPVCLGKRVNGANKETERTTSGEKNGAANEHSIVKGKKCRGPGKGEERE